MFTKLRTQPNFAAVKQIRYILIEDQKLYQKKLSDLVVTDLDFEENRPEDSSYALAWRLLTKISRPTELLSTFSDYSESKSVTYSLHTGF